MIFDEFCFFNTRYVSQTKLHEDEVQKESQI